MMVRSDFCRLEFTVGERDKKFVHVHSSCFLTGHLTGSIGVLTCQGIRSILESHAEKRIRRKETSCLSSPQEVWVIPELGCEQVGVTERKDIFDCCSCEFGSILKLQLQPVESTLTLP